VCGRGVVCWRTLQMVMGMQINTALLASYIEACKEDVAAAATAAAASTAATGTGTGTATATGTRPATSTNASSTAHFTSPAVIDGAKADGSDNTSGEDGRAEGHALPLQYHFESRVPPELWDTAAAEFRE